MFKIREASIQESIRLFMTTMKRLMMAFMLVLIGSTTILATNNYALKFGASADYVAISNSVISSITGSTAATFELWVKPASSSETARLIDNMTSGGSDGFLFDLLSGKPRLIFGSFGVTATTSLSAGIWYHVAVTSDGDSLRLYINGFHNASAYCYGTLPSNSYNIRLGLDQSGSNHFTGMMREVRIWNYARSQSQILAALAESASSGTSGLLGCWHLDESSGTTAADVNGTYTGTLYNYAYTSSSGWVQLLSGSGTSSSPYQISSLENLLCLASNSAYWGSYIKQTATIAASGISNFLPIGTSRTNFTGTYDGNHYTISGLKMSRTAQYTGLFGYVSGSAAISNLGVTSATIKGYHYTGILAGFVQNSSTIRQCFSTGTVTSTGSSVGGLVGELQSGSTISNCYTTATVSTSCNGANVGGLLGYNYGTVSYCYAASVVTCSGGYPALGGLIGNSTTVATTSFYNSDLCSSGSTYATPESADSMKIQDTYTARGWDFSSTWGISPGSNSGYPCLLNFQLIVNTQAMISTGLTTAIGNGTIVCFGSTQPTAYGFCWSKTNTLPTIANDTVNLGATSNTGSFSVSITGLTEHTTYYIRAYAIDASGTYYGGALTFTTIVGSGTSSDPYQIATLSHLYWVSQNSEYWSAYFIQTADIDASDTKNWNSGAGFSPIGNDTTNFTGQYNGQGHTIKELYINRSSTNYIGLFGYIGNGGVVRSLIVAANTINGKDEVGALAGYSNGTIRSCSTSGSVTGVYNVGGLVGQGDGAIANCYTTNSVSGSYYYVGGVVGYWDGTMSTCSATGNVSGKSYVGGVMGYGHSGTTSNCNATGSVFGYDFVGGFVGYIKYGTINNCYATGSVSVGYWVGGFAGINSEGTINNCYATGSVSGGNYVGGFAGENDKAINNCYYDINTTGQSYPIGLNYGSFSGNGLTTAQMKQSSNFSGWNFSTVWAISSSINNGYPYLFTDTSLASYSLNGSGTSSDPYQISQWKDLYCLTLYTDYWASSFRQTANIDVSSISNFIPIGNSDINFTGYYNGAGHKVTSVSINRSSINYVGLFGYIGSGGKVDSLAISIDTIKGQNEVGGLAGYSNGTIKSCSTSGIVIGTTDVGGLIGTTGGGTVCYSHSSTTLNGSNNVSGLIGTNSGNISYCYSTGNATATGDYTAGGLVGWNNSGTISNCYSTGTVKGPSPAGGLVGGGGGTITNCYAVNTVTCTNSTSNVGGLIGNGVSATINNSYYNTDIFTGSTSYGTGIATDAMQIQSTFTDVGWDFTDVWGISTSVNDGYPYLQWTVEEDNSLAVELTGFTVVLGSRGVRLIWRTESETENLGFIIQRKTVGANHDSPSDWSQIASYTTADSLAGHGSTSETHAYAWTDAAVAANTTYAYRLGDVDYSGKCTWHSAVEVEVGEYATLPTEFGLQKAYPNPFNPTTTIRFDLPNTESVTLKVFDLLGREVATLVNETKAAGSYSVTFDASGLASGIYLYRLQAGRFTSVRKLLLVR